MDDTDLVCPGARTLPRGTAILQDPLLNKGTAFTARERLALGLTGLLPPHVHTMDEQVARVMDNYRRKTSNLERYIHLMALQDRNETLFYRVLCDHLEEMMPIVYTPTVGEACQQFHQIFRSPRGLYLSIRERGRLADVLRSWPRLDVRAIVVTDGERILGLGDQGVGGMGIPIGKLSLYTACGGIPPGETLPVTLDVGTGNEAYLVDPLYMGLRQPRVRGEAYDAFIDELMEAVQEVWPRCLVQFEDFGNSTAFGILERWRGRACCFNDDIQGTAAVTLAGLLSALRLSGQPLAGQRVLFLGAGEAGVGIGELIATAIAEAGVPREEARRRCWFVDSQGLVVKSRTGLARHKVGFAHEAPPQPDLRAAIEAVRPTALVGVSAQPGAFDRGVIEAMGRMNERPIVFALSNPTSRAECTAEDAYRWSHGKVLFASGSPFPPVTVEGRTFVPGQGNNAYIFPGVGLGILASGARLVTDHMFSRAARALAEATSQSDLDLGRLFPSLQRIREVSLKIATAVAEEAFDEGLATVERPPELARLVEAAMWRPRYPTYVG